jgi:5-hydroxyisourate hydrolase
MKGHLSTHVLDIENGRPAAGLSLELWRITKGERALLKRVVTNADGRTDGSLLGIAEMQPGEYEIVFQVGAYFGVKPENSFLNEVPVRFNIVDPTEGYHVPLVVSRWAYNTYRGR